MKSDTEEKYLQQVNRVIDYINSHLNEPLRVETLAREVCLSEYHFHRIMRAYLHEPLATYIARQRVERAVMYLQMFADAATAVFDGIARINRNDKDAATFYFISALSFATGGGLALLGLKFAWAGGPWTILVCAAIGLICGLVESKIGVNVYKKAVELIGGQS